MKIKILLAIVAVLAVVAVPTSTFAVSPNQTVITGVISTAGDPSVQDAAVTVTCNGNVLTDTSNGAGKYKVTFDADDCPDGSAVTVTASKGGASGSNSGTGQAGRDTEINVVLTEVDVALPEMGTIVGGIAALGAGGAFLIVRRKQQAQL